MNFNTGSPIQTVQNNNQGKASNLSALEVSTFSTDKQFQTRCQYNLWQAKPLDLSRSSQIKKELFSELSDGERY